MIPEHETTEDDLRLRGVDIDRRDADVQLARGHVWEELFGEPSAPPRIGRFEVLHRVGEGGMGVVYAAYDPELDRKVALKVLRRDRAAARATASRRLRDEARAAARLTHPNVVTIYEVGESDGELHIAMELLDAVTLRVHTERLVDDWRAVLRALVAAGDGLGAAHRAGLVHRDFKPENVLVAIDGRVCVTDFGLALTEPSEPGGALEPSTDLHATIGWAGTVPYMAPEQLRGEPLGPASDQFAFCVTAWEALFGVRPFAGAGPEALLQAIDRGQPRSSPTHGRELPAALRRVLARGLAVRPDARHPSMDALLAELRSFTVAPQRSIWPWALGVTALGGAAVAAFWPAPTHCDGEPEAIALVWSPQHAATIASAFTDTRLPYADDAARRVTAQLDAYAEAWVQLRATACRDTKIDERVDADVLAHRNACLDARRDRLALLVDELSRADASAVESAVTAAAGLPALAACTGADAPAGPIALPEDPAMLGAVRDALAQLDRVTVLRQTAHVAEASARIEALAPSVAAIAYDPLTAALALEQGRVAALLADPVQAETSFDRALEHAARTGESQIAAEAAIDLVRTVGVTSARHDDAAALVRAARLAITLAGARVELRARLTAVESRLAYEAGDYPGATAAATAALELLRAAHGEDDLERAEALHVLANADYGRGDPAASLEHNRDALRIREEWLGARHPLVADSLANLGAVQLASGDLESAEVALERALTIREAALGADHPALADVLANLAQVHAHRKAHDRAHDMLERALAIATSRFGAQHPRVASIRNNLAAVTTELGRLDEAENHARAALVIQTAAYGERHPSVATSVAQLGEVQRLQGRGAAAVASLQQALALREEALGLAHPLTVRALVALGEAELTAGKPADARGHLERARPLAPAADVAEIDRLLAAASE